MMNHPMQESQLPQLAWIKQHFDPSCITDMDQAVSREIDGLSLSSRVKPGQSVAITAGSRGIDRIDQGLTTLGHKLSDLGLQPFIVPAMGSHGGASAKGQTQVLASYGITEERTGLPIRSSMETITVGETSLGTPVFLDRFAFEADHIAVVNRIKAHTKFKADIESGLMKMMAIGLGKHTGAARLHALAPIHSLESIILETGRSILQGCPVLLGLGLVENAFGQCAAIQAMSAQDLEKTEKGLLFQAKNLSASPGPRPDPWDPRQRPGSRTGRFLHYPGSAGHGPAEDLHQRHDRGQPGKGGHPHVL